jgi:hypothetical protein
VSTEADLPFSPFVAELITASYAITASTTNAVLDLQQARIDELEAELYAVRSGVGQLLSGRWMPTSAALQDALYCPAQRLIDEYKASKAAER